MQARSPFAPYAFDDSASLALFDEKANRYVRAVRMATLSAEITVISSPIP
jgi:hypothetical protein